MPPPSRNIKLAYGFLALLALIAGIILFIFDPADHGFYPACPLHSLTGLACPTCGLLRAAHLLLHGEIHAAFELNPLLFFLIPAAGILCLFPAIRRARWMPGIAIGILFFWFVWRNWL